MKSAVIVLLCAAMASSRVAYIEEWPANDMQHGGVRGVFEYGDISNGSCKLIFPTPVYWFHCENCDIVPSSSNTAEGVYALSASNKAWEDIGHFTFVMNFLEEKFDESEVNFDCDPEDGGQLTVYSFPTNTEQREARSRVYEQGDGRWPNYLITFPVPVKNFTVDHPNTFKSPTPDTFMVQNVQKSQKEIWFQFRYDGTWFSAADISVAHFEDFGNEEEELRRKRRNAHF